METLELLTSGKSVVLRTDWKGLRKISDDPDYRGFRITYDRGLLELRPVSFEHGHGQELVSSLLTMYMWSMKIRFVGGGDILFARQELDRGLQPDKSYWIQSHSSVVGLREWDPSVHPPPDLVVEMEVSRTVVKRLPVLAAIGVPEVWRNRRGRLTVLQLNGCGAYDAVPASRFLPSLPLSLVQVCLDMGRTCDTTTVLEAFLSRLGSA